MYRAQHEQIFFHKIYDSGSDLDGDEYFVCWLETLMPRIPNKQPGAYEAADTKLEDKPITPAQVTEQVVKHITKPNNLGKSYTSPNLTT